MALTLALDTPQRHVFADALVVLVTLPKQARKVQYRFISTEGYVVPGAADAAALGSAYMTRTPDVTYEEGPDNGAPKRGTEDWTISVAGTSGSTVELVALVQ